jgi:hypothetical protein
MIPQQMRLVRCHRWLVLGVCLGLPGIFLPLGAAEITVGPGYAHSRIEDALAEAQRAMSSSSIRRLTIGLMIKWPCL